MPSNSESEPSMRKISWPLASTSFPGHAALENATRWLPQTDGESFSQFLGASLLSATGSLPQHLAPLIIIVIVADGRIAVSDAGWILSVRAIGELLASIVLPLIGIVELGRTIALAASALFLGALVVAQLADLTAMLLGFFVLGATGGVLKFLGTLAASTYRNRTFAFLFRLASVLGIAGAAICVLYGTNAFTSYPTLLERLMVIVLPILMLGGCLYKPLRQRVAGSAHPEQAAPNSGMFGLLILYLFFVAISGFMAYVGQQAAMRGLSIKDTVLSIGTIKIAAGAWLLIAASFLPRDEKKQIVAWEIALLLAAIWLVSLSSNVLEFFAGLLLLEISLNGCSARLQSAIVGAAPHFAGRWLNGVILLGTASGPPLYGLAIGAQMQTVFLGLSSVVICLPLVWQACRMQFFRYELADRSDCNAPLKAQIPTSR
jgi:hypothetical protein